MSQTVQLPNVCDFMARHLVDVFDTMLAMRAVLIPAAELPLFAERVTGSVGFAGETVTGAVYLHLSAPFANRVATAMLGLPPAEHLGENDVNDVVGETTNILTGGLKSWLCDTGADCAVSTPAIIRGTAFVIEPVPDVKREFLVFDCGAEQVMVEIHIKLN
jgi:CheY-specific phosphatase CheX